MVIHGGCVAATARIGFAKGMLCYVKCVSDFPQLKPEFSAWACESEAPSQATVGEK